MPIFVKEGTEEITFFIHFLFFPQEYNKLKLVIFRKDVKKVESFRIIPCTRATFSIT